MPEEFIAKVRESMPTDEQAPNIVLIGRDGELFSEDSNKVLAKSISSRQFDVYYIKRGSNGFFNPYSGIPEKQLAYFKVSKECYDNYAHFLKTKDNTFLSNAERIK
jgi:hypothetical protein